MEKLGALVEEGRVVFVAFDDKGASGAELKAGGKILCHATDEKRRFECRIFAGGYLVDPRQHAGGGGLAVRAGYDE